MNPSAPFGDGNKRTAFASIVFLGRNGIGREVPPEVARPSFSILRRSPGGGRGSAPATRQFAEGMNSVF
jgi:hypothetical protein